MEVLKFYKAKRHFLFIFLIFFVFLNNIANSEDLSFQLDHFGVINVIKPAEPRYFAIALVESSLKSKDLKSIDVAVANGGIVAVISLENYLSAKNWEDDDCINSAGELERLTQVLQKNLKIDRELPSILIADNYSTTLALRVVAEAYETFQLAVVNPVCELLTYNKPLCPVDEAQKIGTDIKNIDLTDSTILFAPDNNNLSCKTSFKGKHILYSKDNTEFNAFFKNAIDSLKPVVKNINTNSIKDLPLVSLVPKDKTPDNKKIIFLSGDGGWASIDKSIGEFLQGKEIGVFGFDCLRFFWKRKTLKESAEAIHNLINTITETPNQNISLIGFSFGADIIPSIYNNLSKEDKAQIKSIVLLSPSRDADLEIHLSDWLPVLNVKGPINVVSEVEKINPQIISCFYGEEEADSSLCTAFKAPKFNVKKFEGDHHFNEDYVKLGEEILNVTSFYP